jgi:hypothetical protein
MSRDIAIPAIGGSSGALGVFYALGEFSIHNIDVMMAALGPLAFRVAPNLPAVDAQALQRIYIAFAIVSALLALLTLARRARKRFA